MKTVAKALEVEPRIVATGARSVVPPVQVDRRRVADRARRQARAQVPVESVANLPVIVARAKVAAETIVVVRVKVVTAVIVVRVFNMAAKAEDMVVRVVTADEVDRIVVRTTVRITR